MMMMMLRRKPPLDSREALKYHARCCLVVAKQQRTDAGCFFLKGSSLVEMTNRDDCGDRESVVLPACDLETRSLLDGRMGLVL